MIFDIECDGLLDKATKIHCMAYTDNGVVKSTTDYNEIEKLILGADVLIGHNIILFDVPVLEKILNIKVKARLIDTLPLAWYLKTKRFLFGLDGFGEDYGIPKPKITDWENLSEEEYLHRCEEDVKINQSLWADLKSNLLELYGSEEKYDRLINYLTFKMKCVRGQERQGWRLNVEKCEEYIEQLSETQVEKFEALKAVMPSVPIIAKKSRPAKPFKQDGTLSSHGEKWKEFTAEKGYPFDYSGEIEYINGYKEPNPNAPPQVKAWLESLGWVPETFDYKKDELGNQRKIPQIQLPNGGGLCPSVVRLDSEDIKHLEGLSVINHRLGVLKGFMSSQRDGWLQARVGGLTNTLRFKHRELVNLPGVGTPWGEEIRSCLIAPRDDMEVCGSDMSSLEDNTKRHFMKPHDPDYVEEMSKEGFDPHLDLAKHAGAVTEAEIEAGDPKVKPLRKKFKVGNYSCVYGVMALTLSRTLGCTVEEADFIIDAYWKRNWSVKKIAEEQEVVTVRGQKWLYNPISELYYSLRATKDIFSTLNQGSGVWCFDNWVREVIKRGFDPIGQFHDEIIIAVGRGKRVEVEAALRDAIKAVNDKLKLNVQLDVSVDFGDAYSDIH